MQLPLSEEEINKFPEAKNWLSDFESNFKKYLDDKTLIVDRDAANYRYPELKVLDVNHFVCQDDTSETYDDYVLGAKFDYEEENLTMNIDISSATAYEIDAVLIG